MRRKLFLIGLLSVFTLSIFAQERTGEKRKADFEKFKAKRTEYISNAVGLTPEESSAFWPLCDQLQEKKFQLNKELRKEMRALFQKEKSGQKPTQEEYARVVKMTVDVKAKEAELEKEYLEKFETVLTPEKIFKYQRAEMKFARTMFDQSGDRKRDSRKGGKPRSDQSNSEKSGAE